MEEGGKAKGKRSSFPLLTLTRLVEGWVATITESRSPSICNRMHLHTVCVVVLCVSLCQCSFVCARHSIFYVCVTCCDLDVTKRLNEIAREKVRLRE